MAAELTVQEQVADLAAEVAAAAQEQLLRTPVELQVTVSLHDLTVLLAAKESIDEAGPQFMWGEEQFKAAAALTEFTNRILDRAREVLA